MAHTISFGWGHTNAGCASLRALGAHTSTCVMGHTNSTAANSIIEVAIV